ncbi:MAG: alpha/beta hydrolase, partial [Planctomycetota bacterium]
GYFVVSINYRLAPKAKMATQVDDCQFAVAWIKSNADQWQLDTKRFALWGYSAGAHLVSLMALQNNQLAMPIRAVVGGGTPADFSFVPLKSPILKHVFGATREKDSEVYLRFSPTNYLRKDSPPFFLFHGDQDFLVPHAVGRKLHDQLVEVGAESTFFSVRGKGHLMTFLDRNARKKAIAFLDQHLQPGEKQGPAEEIQRDDDGENSVDSGVNEAADATKAKAGNDARESNKGMLGDGPGESEGE